MNLHLIIGEDDFLVNRLAKKAIGEFAVEEIDSSMAGNAEAQLREIAKARESFLTPPFFDPNKATWWRNVKFLPGAERLAEEVKTALEEFAKLMVERPLPDNQTMVITGPKLLKTSVFAKILQDAAAITMLTPLKGRAATEQATAAAIDFAAEEGVRFAAGAAEALVAKTGTDTRSLLSEVGKLKNYLGDGRNLIKAEDVAAISSPGAGMEPNFWAITDAIGSRNADKAVAAAMEFKTDTGFAVMVSGAIERFFRQMLDLEAIEDTLAPFQVRNLQMFKRNWTTNEMRTARFRFMNLRERAVSSGGEAVEELIVTEIIRACTRRIR